MKALRRQVLELKTVAQRVEVETAISFVRRGERVPLEQFQTLAPYERGRVDMHKPEYNTKLKERAENRMALLDDLPKEWRDLANELGLPVVREFRAAGLDCRVAKRLICLARGQQMDGRPAAFGNIRVGKGGGK